MRLSASDTGLELFVRDDGNGIKTSPGPRAGGMGLHIMDYRARSIGGSLEIQGAQGGTTVLCRVPQRAGNLAEDCEALAG